MPFNSKPTTLAAFVAALTLTAGACSSSGGIDASAAETPAQSTSDDTGSSVVQTSSNAVFDATEVHTIQVEFDVNDYDEMIATFQAESEKEWIAATITIDGSTYRDAGIRLKGNSSLAGIGGGFGGRGGGDAGEAGGPRGGAGGDTSVEEPEGLPWLIKLDKFVDDQAHEGVSDFVVRSNNSETSLNEAVALNLLAEAGLATQDAMAVRFSVNGSDDVLRLVIEHPDDIWMADNFDIDDALYKAESTGNYSYRGDNPEAYDEVFDQEAGKQNTDLTPLIDFLDFINNSDDETFAAELSERFDVESFAVYLAMQDIVNNFDDISGPGNNSYLHWDAETGRFTVVPWDYNLAFGGLGGGPGGGFGGGPGEGGGFGPGGFDPDNLPEGFELPEGFDPENPPEGFGQGGFVPGDVPEGFEPPQGFDAEGAGRGPGGVGGGPGGGGNVLVERFLAVESFSAMYDDALTDLQASLIDSGRADEIIEQWVAVLEAGAGDLVDAATIQSEADQISATL